MLQRVCLCACVARSAALIWGWGQGRGGVQRGEACVVGRVCLEEIRKIKTELRGEKPAFVANIHTSLCPHKGSGGVFAEMPASLCFLFDAET